MRKPRQLQPIVAAENRLRGKPSRSSATRPLPPVAELEAEYRRIEAEWMVTPSFSLREMEARRRMTQARERLASARSATGGND